MQKFFGSSGYPVANLANAISLKGLGDCTADQPIHLRLMRPSEQALGARSKEFLMKKYSELCELRASVVNIPSHETRKNQVFMRVGV
jgi:hypothetical protein